MRVSLRSFDLLLVLTSMAPAAGCGLGPEVHGTVNIQAGTQSSQAVTIDGCYSSTGGGVTLTSSSRAILSVAGGAEPSITLESGAGSVASSTPPLSKTDCARLQVDTHDGASHCTGDCDGDDPDRAETDGSVHAQCTLPGGGALKADVTFSGC
jgi:hypothetical protein